MELKKIILLLNILICFSIFITTVNAQTYTVKTVPADEYKELFKSRSRGGMVITNAIEEKKKGRHFKNRMIYISNNSAYFTFVPYLGYDADSLLYTYPNVPTFTYLKNFDVIVEKLEDSTKIHSKSEFINRFGYKSTNEFKNYHGTQVQKYVSKGNFYEMYFWVAEGESSESDNDFISILKTMGLLDLDTNKKVVAINYLGSEFPINFIQLSHKSRQNLNKELFENINVSIKAEEKQKKIYEPVTNSEDIKHLLNKGLKFNYKRTRSNTDFDFESGNWESDTYLNDNNTNRIQFFKDKFFASIDNFVLQGHVDENGDLIYESSSKRIEKPEKHTTDFSSYKLLYLNKSGDNIDFCVQEPNKFWSFTRYTFATKTKDFKHLNIDLILPNGETYEGLIKSAITFNAIYTDLVSKSSTPFEYSTSLNDIEQLKTTQTYVIKE